MRPDDQHGDERHLVMQDLVDAAESNDSSVRKTLQNIDETTRKVLNGQLESEAWPAEE
jgi:hypothetical protein